MLLINDGSGGKLDLDGGSPLTRALNKIADQTNTGVDDALVNLYRFLRGDALAADIKTKINAAITAAATDNDTLKAILANPVVDFLVARGADGLPVPRKLRDVKAKVEYVLQKSGDGSKLGAGDVHLSFGAKANASATIDVVHEVTDALPPFPSGDALLTFALHAGVDLEGAFKVPFNGGSAGGSAAFGADVTLQAAYEWASSDSVVAALVHSASSFGSPWDLDDVNAKLQAPNTQGEHRGLRQISLKTTGSMQLNGSIGVGHTWGYVKKDFAGASDLTASLGIDLSLNVGLARSGDFTFVVQRPPSGGGVQIDVHRDATQAQTFGFDMNAGLTITGLGQIVQPVVNRAFPDPAELMSKLKQWSAPGTLVVDKLVAKLPANDPALQTLGQLLLGTVPKADAAQHLQQIITDRVGELLDTSIPFWQTIDKPDVLAQLLSSNVVKLLGLDGAVATSVGDALQTRLQDIIGNAKKAFGDDVTQLFKGAGQQLDDLLAPFAAIGQDVEQLKKAVNKDAAAIVDPAIKLLQRYEEIRDKVMQAVAVASKLKLGLALKYAYEKQETRTAELSLRIDKFTPRTRMVYRALLLGRLDSVWGLLQLAVDNHEAQIISGAFHDTIARKKQLDFSLSFGDWIAAWQHGGAATAQIGVEANGMISLDSQSRFSAKNAVSAFGASGGASFGGTLDVAAALHEPETALPVTFGFALNYTDSKMTPADLSTYVNSIINRSAVPLLDVAAVGNALKLYGDKPADARVDTVVNLDAKQIAVLLAVAQNDPQRVLAVAREVLITAQATNGNHDRILAAIADSRDAPAVARMLGEFRQHHTSEVEISQRVKAKTSEDLGFGPLSPANQLWHDIQRLNEIADGLLSALTALATCRDRLLAAIPPGVALTPADKAHRYVVALDGVNKSVLDGLDRWFGLTGLQPDKAPPLTIALLAALARLGNASPPMLVPVLQARGGPNDPLRLIAF